MADTPPRPHAARDFPGLRLDSYSLDLPAPDGQQLGDRASNRAFDALLDAARESLVATGMPDPFPDAEPGCVTREMLDMVLAEGSPEAAGLVQGAIEEFARDFAEVVRRFLALPEWQGTAEIRVGGGFRSARVGEIAVGRAMVILRTGGVEVVLRPIRHDPDEAGLIGPLHLLPPAVLGAADAVLTADLGGTSFRAGLVLPRLGVARDLSAAQVWRSRAWRHADTAAGRRDAVGQLAAMLRDLAGEAAAQGIAVPPMVALGCPGEIAPDGRVLRGGGNLPGDWHAPGFRLPEALASAFGRQGGAQGGAMPGVVMHNDAVCQGLAEAPFRTRPGPWGVLTIGTGLGNARFTRLEA